MYTILKKDYYSTHKDYRGVYTSDDIHGTNWNGRKTIMKNIDGATCLLIENKSFVIVATAAENVNPI